MNITWTSRWYGVPPMITFVVPIWKDKYRWFNRIFWNYIPFRTFIRRHNWILFQN